MRGRGYLLGAALFLGLSLGSVSEFACDRLGRWRPYPAPAPAPPAARPMDVDLLVRVAESEDPEAAVAVMWTVLNRAAFSHRAISAVAVPGAYHGLRSRVRTSAADLRMRERLRKTAQDLLAGRVADPTGGARYFHRLGTAAPPWAPPARSWRIFGRHAFYRGRSCKACRFRWTGRLNKPILEP